MALIAERLADLAIRLWQHEKGAVAELEKFATVHWINADSFSARGPSGILCGFVLGHDPITQAAQLALLFLGPLWPSVVPELLRLVDQRWKAKRAEAEPCSFGVSF